ncbi:MULTISPECIES: glycosyl hydrolase [Treponema]|uniref:Mannan endo-1,4-beta-mannosidase n=2 Tax=Treponema saccharophilum TaxID=165 RepID=H7EHR0_9SPIR|nr:MULTISPECIES: glycosyl hydrolase [Treponema]EIC02850.1 Mannan endo-1,4-beta-mannosidase [Treponema saccharophilum DSM 2985]MBQ5537474.1 hypothetical protein [Treponema sp.]BDC97368.1 hypothetical protein TRSA_24670 [Treponema saccharophilum]
MRRTFIAVFCAAAAALMLLQSCQTSGAGSGISGQEGGTYMPEKESPVEIPEGKSAGARALMRYIADCRASGAVLSGQQDLTWDDSYGQLQKVFGDTGKYPAIAGFDFMNYTQVSGGSGQHQTEEALEFLKKGGIAAFCWHWRDPSGKTIEFNSEKTAFRIPYKADSESGLDESSEDFAMIASDLERIAAELQRIRDAGYPVLWRPLHEAYGNKDDWGGAWFWWGAGCGSADGKGRNRREAYLALYKYMHRFLTKEKGLDNLIWVWNAQNADWYPGDEFVDVVAYDNYKLGELGTQYEMLRSVSGGKKIIALGENGTIPDVSSMSGKWAYFTTWNDHSSDESQCFWSCENHNTLSHRKEVYGSGNVITLDELPELWK